MVSWCKGMNFHQLLQNSANLQPAGITYYSFSSVFHPMTMLNTLLLPTASIQKPRTDRERRTNFRQNSYCTRENGARCVSDCQNNSSRSGRSSQWFAPGCSFSPSGHGYCSSRAPVPASHTTAQGSSSTGTREVPCVHTSVSPPHLCLKPEPTEP